MSTSLLHDSLAFISKFYTAMYRMAVSIFTQTHMYTVIFQVTSSFQLSSFSMIYYYPSPLTPPGINFNNAITV